MHIKCLNKIASVLFIVMLVLVVLPVTSAYAAGTILSTASGGLWSTGTTWVGGIAPSSADSAVIVTGATVILDNATTVDALTIQSGATLDTDATHDYPLLVESNFTNSGTLEAQGSTITINGAFLMDAGAFNGALSSLNLKGSVNLAGGTFTAGSVNYGSAGDQTIIGTSYIALSTSGGSGIKTIGGNVTVIGTLTVGTGTTFKVGAFNIAVTGATTINGTLLHSSATGTKTYNGNVTINSGGTWNETVAVAVTFGGNLQNDGNWSAGTGTHTFNGPSKTFGGANPISIPSATITGAHTNNGTLTVSTTLTVTGVTLTNNGTLSVGATLTGTGGLIQGTGASLLIGGVSTITTMTATANSNTVNYNKAGAQTVNATTSTYHHLILSGSGAKNLANVTMVNGDLTLSTLTPGSTTTTTATASAFTIGGNLNIGASTTFAVGGFNMVVAGDTNVNGTLTHPNATGTKTYTGDVVIHNGGTWNETAAAVITFGGNLQNDGTFTAGTGTHTFTGTNKAFNGVNPISIPSTTISGSYTNNVTLTVNSALAGAGSLTQAASATLNIGASAPNFTLSTLNASASGNTVNYTGAAQTVKAVTYHHLILSGSGDKTLTGLTTINGNLTFAGTTASAVTTNALHIGGNLTLSGTAVNAVATGAALTIDGNLSIAGTGSTTFTVGAFPINVTGTTTISGVSSSVNSTLIHTTGATPTYVGLVTISPNGIWDNSANDNINLRGGLRNNSAKPFSAGIGVYTFNTNDQVIDGTNAISIPNITVSGVTLTNNNALTVGTALIGTGGLTQATGATLNIGGTLGIGTLTAIASGNTVNYNGAAQTVRSTPYNNLILSGSDFKTFLPGLTTINGNLTLSETANTTSADNLTIGGAFTIGTGTAFTVGPFDITVVGATTINGSGILNHSSATGTKIYTGDVTINNGSTWLDNAEVIPISFGGSFQNNGTLVAGIGAHTFTGTDKTLSGTISIPNIAISGSYTNNGTLTASTSLSGAGSLTQGTPNPTLNLGGTSTIAILNASINPNTVKYNMIGGQTIKGTTYHHLITGGGFTKILGEAVIVNGDLTIGSGITLDVSSSNYPLTVKGNWINSGGTFTPQSGTVTLQGSLVQTMSGASSFNNLTIDNSTGVTLSNNMTVNGILTLTNGKITTGGRALIIGTDGSVTGVNSVKYIVGNVQKIFATGAQAFTFDIGDATNYMPVFLNFANISIAGNVTVSTTAGEHQYIATSGLDSTKDVNRFWTLTPAGSLAFSTYDATFNFVDGDKDAGVNPSLFVVKRNINATTWAPTTIGSRTALSTQATGINALGSFAIGQTDTSVPTVTNVTSTKANGSYTTGILIPVTVTFSELVNVSGTPQLTLKTAGITNRTVNYVSGNGTTTLTFNYTVQAGDNSSDLDYVAPSSLTLNSGTIHDPANNNASLTLPIPGASGSLGANKDIVIDTTAPTVTMSSTALNPTNVSPIPVTAQFSENVTGFSVSDIVPGNATVGSFVAVDGDTYTFSLTPSGQGAVTADIAASAAQDLAGNNNTAATQFSLTYDSIAPTVTMSSTALNPTNVSPVPVTAQFSENVTGFSVSDIVPGNATVGSFVAVDGDTYTFNLTPSGQGPVTADIAAGAAKDLAGNNNTAATQFSITYDTVAPSVTMSSTALNPTNVSPIPVTAQFSENVTGFSVSDIVPGNATVGSFVAVDGDTYTFSLTPNGQGPVTADIAAGAAKDLAGNNNTAATQFSLTYDSIAPTVTMSSTALNPTNVSPVPVTAQFSENVTGFSVSDIVPGNATVGSFVVVDGDTYTFSLTPSGQGAVTADIAASAAQDLAGNNNTAATQFSITYDTVAPSVTMSSTALNPTNVSPIPVTAQFSENVTGFSVSDIVPGNATVGSFVAVDGDTYTFSLTPSGQGPVTADIASGAAKDLAGNNNTAAIQFSITYDTVAPSVTMSSTALNPTNVSPIVVTVTFSETVTGFDSSDIVAGNGTVGNFAGSGASYSFDLTPTTNGLVTADIAAGAAKDLAGNNNTAATQFSRTYNGIETTFRIFLPLILH